MANQNQQNDDGAALIVGNAMIVAAAHKQTTRFVVAFGDHRAKGLDVWSAVREAMKDLDL